MFILSLIFPLASPALSSFLLFRLAFFFSSSYLFYITWSFSIYLFFITCGWGRNDEDLIFLINEHSTYIKVVRVCHPHHHTLGISFSHQCKQSLIMKFFHYSPHFFLASNLNLYFKHAITNGEKKGKRLK